MQSEALSRENFDLVCKHVSPFFAKVPPPWLDALLNAARSEAPSPAPAGPSPAEVGERLEGLRQAVQGERGGRIAAEAKLAALAMPGEEEIARLSELVSGFFNERHPEGAMPGGIQVFADDDIDAEFKHEAGCEALVRFILAALFQGAKG